jgi:hypothetical protein
MGNLGDKLYMEMPFDEIVRLLGEPTGINPGPEMIESGPQHIIAVPDKTRILLENTKYCMWKRSEGIYLLVIEYEKLARINQKP